MIVCDDVRLHALIVHQMQHQRIAQVNCLLLLDGLYDLLLLVVAVEVGVPLNIRHRRRLLLHIFLHVVLLTDYTHCRRIVLSEKVEARVGRCIALFLRVL